LVPEAWFNYFVGMGSGDRVELDEISTSDKAAIGIMTAGVFIAKETHESKAGRNISCTVKGTCQAAAINFPPPDPTT
jgi:hypothetical protein